jgi:hypothetical protein
MKTLGALLAMLLIAGASFFYQRGPGRSSGPGGPCSVGSVPGGERATASPALVRPRRSLVKPRSSPPSPAGAESALPPKLPLSTADVALTPKLEEAYQELYKTFGPGVTTWIDGKLARRAALAKCGIDEPGAAKFVLRSRVDPKSGTQTVEGLDTIVTTYKDDMNEIVIDCIRDTVVGTVEKHVSAAPDWFNDEQRHAWQNSALDFEIDTVNFPVEGDELYRLFSDGRASAYQETETKARYGWK